MVSTETMIMIATSAAIGMLPTMLPRSRINTGRNTPASRVDRRVRAPDSFTLIMVCPISAYGPMMRKVPASVARRG